jgi:alkylhydroperoxidase/carboxymuconolactone decarboxylase family protein YurZ
VTDLPPGLDGLADLDPAFLKAYRDFSTTPWRTAVLEAKVKEFIHIALDIAATHLHRAGARAHIAAAFRLGATREELIDLCELVCTLGIHTMTMAAPILAEELVAAGHDIGGAPSADQERIRSDYIAARGLFPPPLEPLLAMDPAFIEAYGRLSAIPVQKDNLDAKVVELVLIALDSSTTHLHATGTRAHIRKALLLGASPAEILEVLELTSVLGIQGTELGVGLVLEEYDKIDR